MTLFRAGTIRVGRDPRGGPLVRLARRLGRGARLSLLVVRALVEAERARRVLRQLPWEEAARFVEARQAWFLGRVLEIFRVRVRTEGAPLAHGHLAASNHVGILDIPAIADARPALFVAKAQIATWPVLGFIIAAAGTIFIARERARDSIAVLSRMERAIAAGRRVLFFPEGTTSPGDRVLRFHTSLFEVACRLRVPVQPVALFYEDLVDRALPSRAVPFVGEQDVVRNLWAVLAEPQIDVRVCYLPPEEPGSDRRELADRTRLAIARRLGVPLDDGPAGLRGAD